MERSLNYDQLYEHVSPSNSKEKLYLRPAKYKSLYLCALISSVYFSLKHEVVL